MRGTVYLRRAVLHKKRRNCDTIPEVIVWKTKSFWDIF